MSRHAFVDHKTKLLLFWTPKVGCTSLAHWFVLGALGKQRGFVRDTSYTGPREWLEGEGFSIEYSEALELAANKGYETCMVARHPAARAVSGYIDKFVTHLDGPLDSFEALEDFSAKEYRRWKNPHWRLWKKPYEGLSFMDFLGFIKNAVDARKRGEARLNHHWNTQVPFHFRDSGFKYDHVFYLENFNEVIEWLSMRYGVELELPKRQNKTKYGTEPHEGIPNMSSLELCQHPEWLSRENFMTRDALGIIKDAYEIDYEYFEYDPYVLKLSG